LILEAAAGFPMPDTCMMPAYSSPCQIPRGLASTSHMSSCVNLDIQISGTSERPRRLKEKSNSSATINGSLDLIHIHNTHSRCGFFCFCQYMQSGVASTIATSIHYVTSQDHSGRLSPTSTNSGSCRPNKHIHLVLRITRSMALSSEQHRICLL
jgi:hypothetical protein